MAMAYQIIHLRTPILISGSSVQISLSGGNICPDRPFSWCGRRAEQVQIRMVRLNMGTIWNNCLEFNHTMYSWWNFHTGSRYKNQALLKQAVLFRNQVHRVIRKPWVGPVGKAPRLVRSSDFFVWNSANLRFLFHEVNKIWLDFFKSNLRLRNFG